jgi:hypothetical protein
MCVKYIYTWHTYMYASTNVYPNSDCAFIPREHISGYISVDLYTLSYICIYILYINIYVRKYKQTF